MKSCVKTCCNYFPHLADRKWKTDPNSGKLYLKESSDWNVESRNRDSAKTNCLKAGGMLPEPRNKEENDFLNSFQTNVFFLGMTDTSVEGSWVFDSDQSAVNKTFWRRGDPAGGINKNCAVMTRNLETSNAERWSTVGCTYSPSGKSSVICENTRKYNSYLSQPPTKTHKNSKNRNKHNYELSCSGPPILSSIDVRMWNIRFSKLVRVVYKRVFLSIGV